MALSAAAYKSLVLTQVGDIPGDEVANAIDVLWDMHSDKATSLRFLYVKREALDIVIRYYRKAISFSSSGDLSVQRQQLFDHAQAERKNVNDEIQMVSKRRSSRGAIAEIERKAPIQPGDPSNTEETTIADPNDRMYKGDPYRRRGR